MKLYDIVYLGTSAGIIAYVDVPNDLLAVQLTTTRVNIPKLETYKSIPFGTREWINTYLSLPAALFNSNAKFCEAVKQTYGVDITTLKTRKPSEPKPTKDTNTRDIDEAVNNLANSIKELLFAILK